MKHLTEKIETVVAVNGDARDHTFDKQLCKHQNCRTCTRELAMSAFYNEILAFPVTDEYRQYKALMAAHAHACIYTPDYKISTLALQRELVDLARRMGYSL